LIQLLKNRLYTNNLNLAVTPFFMAFSSLSMTLVRPEFPATFAVDVLDPLRRVSSCRLASTSGSLL